MSSAAQGAQAPAYTPIVAGGANACVLHYVQNDAMLKDGELLLIDAGCELDGYASDITRTFPVSGKFAGTPARYLRNGARSAGGGHRAGEARQPNGKTRTMRR